MVLSNESLKNFFTTDIPGEVISSLIVMCIVIIISLIAGIEAHFHNPLKKSKGLLFLFEFGVSFFDKFVENQAGPGFSWMSSYIMGVAMYLFIGFIFGLTGLPSPVTNLAIPLTVALCTFVLIHAVSIKYTKWSYFKRYIDPIPIFLPINLLSMWAPLLSLAFRLFGNALAGWTLMSVVYYAMQNLSAKIFTFMPVIGGNNWNEIFLAPFVTSILHLYFDLISAFIQTLVFITLSAINISMERPEDYIENLEMKGGN